MAEESAENGNKPEGGLTAVQAIKLLLFLPVFGLLGAFFFMEFIAGVRALFGGAPLYLALRLACFLLPVALLLFAFRLFRPVRRSFGPSSTTQAGLLLLAWSAFYLGAIVWRVNWRSPATVMVDEMDTQRRACRSRIASVLQVRALSDSLKPGDGYIVLKASFLAKTRLTVWGGGWLDSDKPGMAFHSEMLRAELEPGVPRELEIHLVANPDYEGIPKLTADGPYSFLKIPVYVIDPVKAPEWSAIGHDCKADVITGFVTSQAYKAADFGREPWTGGIDSSFGKKPKAR